MNTKKLNLFSVEYKKRFIEYINDKGFSKIDANGIYDNFVEYSFENSMGNPENDAYECLVENGQSDE